MKNEKIVKIKHKWEMLLIKSNYQSNNKIYYWLIEKATWEYFSDITVNLDSNINDFENYNFIDWDFIDCVFNRKIEDCKKRLEKTLKIKGFWKVLGYYYFIL